jgi:hypothetical protein
LVISDRYGIIDNGDKLFTGVNDNGDKLFTSVNDTSDKLFTGLNNTGDKLFTGVNDTVDKFGSSHLHGDLVLVTCNKFIAGIIFAGDNCSLVS